MENKIRFSSFFSKSFSRKRKELREFATREVEIQLKTIIQVNEMKINKQ